MEVYRERGFQPVVITLDKYEEARRMWCLLRVPDAVVAKTNEDIGYVIDEDLAQKMFASFNNEFGMQKMLAYEEKLK